MMEQMLVYKDNSLKKFLTDWSTVYGYNTLIASSDKYYTNTTVKKTVLGVTGYHAY